jgi:hypothetical protein
MHTARRFLVTILVPALIVSIFAVGSATANGSSGKVNLCHWANQKFVKISVSMNAKPAHMQHGDVDPDEYGDCDGVHDGDHESSHGHHGGSGDRHASRDKSSHVRRSWAWSGKGSGGSNRSNGGGDKN